MVNWDIVVNGINCKVFVASKKCRRNGCEEVCCDTVNFVLPLNPLKGLGLALIASERRQNPL
jgi:hypothetical protein